jgi:Uma2 family endonuclease
VRCIFVQQILFFDREKDLSFYLKTIDLLSHKISGFMKIVEDEILDLNQLRRQGELLISFPGTLEEFYSLGEVKGDFIEDIIHVHMGATVRHEAVFMELATLLNIFVKTHQFGKTFGSNLAIGISKNYHPEPDIFFVHKDNPGTFANDRFDGIPDLVIEILSKSTRKLDLEEKRTLYQQNRVPELYFVDLRKMKSL